MNRSRSASVGLPGSMRNTLKYAATRMSTQDRHEPRCGVLVLCEVSMMRARISRATSRRRSMLTRAGASRLVDIVERLGLELRVEAVDPGDRLIQPLLEGDVVGPAERLAQLGAAEQVGGVFAGALWRHVNANGELSGPARAGHLTPLAHAA